MRSLPLALLGATTLWAARAVSAPLHDVCSDVGSTLGLGVSSYSAAEGWPERAQANGVSWKFLYFYVFPSQTPVADMTSFIELKAGVARGLGATLVITFYDLLKRGQSAGLTARPSASNGEADIVQQVLESPPLMRGYFDGYIAVLQAGAQAALAGTATMVHVEPDSWGFMMWAMGVEGQSDASRVTVKVVGSGHPDLVGQSFADDAGGFGQALLYLRTKYAPSVRLGWHASNFRAGTRPEVVTAFYSSMGEWDALLTEDPHVLSSEQNWWEPLDPAAVDTNVSWMAGVSAGSHVPLLMWQIAMGPFDFHLFAEAGGRDVLSRMMGAGLSGMMWELDGTGGEDPDTFRASGLALPPAGSPAGGTAKDLRDRLAAYRANPLAWPVGSPCAAGNADGGSSGGRGGGGASAGGAAGGGTSGGESCNCSVPGRTRPPAWWLLVGLLPWRRRRARGKEVRGRSV
jgi:hypothetical protein